MKYEVLLFDADNTVLDFDKSEEQALKWTFRDMGWDFSENILSVYRRNNIVQWQLFEQGKLTKPEVLINRFVNTFKELNLPLDEVDKAADMYEEYLKKGFFTVPYAEEVLRRLQPAYKMYVVSNGVVSIQNSRMKGSGLEQFFLGRFVSEEVGFPKPQKQYFDYCFEHIGDIDKSKVLIIGDSLTSDIRGGINAGIDTCWFNPNHLVNNSTAKPTYEIDDLRKLYNIV